MENELKSKITESVARLADSVKNIEAMSIEDAICSVGHCASSLIAILDKADKEIHYNKKMYPIVSSTVPLDEVSKFHISEFDNDIKPYCGIYLDFDFEISSDIFTYRQLLKEGRLCKRCRMVAMSRERERQGKNISAISKIVETKVDFPRG